MCAALRPSKSQGLPARDLQLSVLEQHVLDECGAMRFPAEGTWVSARTKAWRCQ
jgi:hypothetical protein